MTDNDDSINDQDDSKKNSNNPGEDKEEKKPEAKIPKEELDSDDDEDEDLIPYDMSNDIAIEDDIRRTGKVLDANTKDNLKQENVQNLLLIDNSK